MPLTFPLPLSEFQERFTISSMQLKLPAVNQMSRTAGGAVIKASLGDELWKGSFSIPPTNSRSDAARLDGLISVLDRGGSFLAFHAAKTHPASDPDGSILGASTPSILSLDSNDARMVAIKGLPAGYELTGGDLIGWSDARRNLLDWSEALDNAVWLYGGLGNPTLSEASGEQRVSWTSGAGNVLQDGIGPNPNAGETWFARFRVKVVDLGGASASGDFEISIRDDAQVDVTNGAITLIDDGAFHDYEISHTFTLPSAGGAYVHFRHSGNGSPVIAFENAQLEEGSLTAYQKTEDGTEFPDTPNYWLHRIVSDVTADGLGETPQFEVVPFIDPGAAPGMAVSLIKPVIKAVMEPDPSYAQDRPAVSSGQQFSFVQTKR